jgi:hypothetical protein
VAFAVGENECDVNWVNAFYFKVSVQTKVSPNQREQKRVLSKPH